MESTRWKDETTLWPVVIRNTLQTLAFANLLDIIPFLSNTEDRVDPAVLRIYQRNAAVLRDFNNEGVIQHSDENNVEE